VIGGWLEQAMGPESAQELKEVGGARAWRQRVRIGKILKALEKKEKGTAGNITQPNLKVTPRGRLGGG